MSLCPRQGPSVGAVDQCHKPELDEILVRMSHLQMCLENTIGVSFMDDLQQLLFVRVISVSPFVMDINAGDLLCIHYSSGIMLQEEEADQMQKDFIIKRSDVILTLREF